MSEADKIKRVKFCKMIKKNYSQKFWRHVKAFYLDGASFPHKYNPASTAKAPKGRVWRKANEGLKQGCAAKRSKTATGGRAVKVMAAISYQKGMIICELHEKMCTVIISVISLPATSS